MFFYPFRDATLESIKADLWKEAKKFPLFYLLADPSAYIFDSITQVRSRLPIASQCHLLYVCFVSAALRRRDGHSLGYIMIREEYIIVAVALKM